MNKVQTLMMMMMNRVATVAAIFISENSNEGCSSSRIGKKKPTQNSQPLDIMAGKTLGLFFYLF